MGGEDAAEGRSGQVEVRLVFKFECKLLEFVFGALLENSSHCREFALAFEWAEAAMVRQRREGGGAPGIEIFLKQVP